MNPMARTVPASTAALLLAAATASSAGVPQLVNYQGRVAVYGTNFNGTGKFKFALVDGGTSVVPATRQATAIAVVVSGGITAITVTDGGAGYLSPPSVEVEGMGGGLGAKASAEVAGGAILAISVTEPGSGYTGETKVRIGPPDAAPHTNYVSFWSHDGSSVGGSEPTTGVSIPVIRGLYSVLLGEAPAMNLIPASVFTNSDIRLRVWFNDGSHGAQQLGPDQRLAAVGYAMMAAAVPDNAITGSMITNSAIGPTKLAPGAVQSAHIAGGAVGTTHLAPGAVASTHLAANAVQSSNIAAGAVTTAALASDSVTSAAIADGAVTTAAIAAGAVTQWKLGGNPAPVGQITVPDPSANNGDQLGASLAAIGAGRLAVGAPHKAAGAVTNAGAVCVFNAGGVLLQTITALVPASGDAFGYSVAAAGGASLAVGVPYADPGAVANAGSVCLFTTNGVYRATISNPAPEVDDYFGLALASLPGGVAVGACYDNPGGLNNAGSVYLYNTNGTLKTTISNPAPAPFDFFGYSITGVGSNLVLIAAHCDDPSGVTDAGSVYLYHTNGTLLLTIPNPEPEVSDWFGQGLADLGDGLLAVGAPGDNAGGADSGSVFLLDTNGVVLTRITNPEPGTSDFFGLTIASAGPQLFVIGACYDDGSAADSGRAYLYDRSGHLLSIITNPCAAAGDYFASSLTTFGPNGVAIGACGSDQAAVDAGRVHFFSIDRIGEPSVTAWNLAAGAVGNVQLASGAVTTDRIADGAVSAEKIANASVTSAALAIGAVQSANILDQTITAADLASNAVDTAKILDGTIRAADVAPNTFWGTSGNGGTAAGTHFAGTTDNVPMELRANNRRAQLFVPGLTPTLIGGSESNTVDAASYGSVIAGGGNSNSPQVIEGIATYSTIGGGAGNRIGRGSRYSTIGGGQDNTVSSNAFFSTVAGGMDNVVDGFAQYSTVGGGGANVIYSGSFASTVAGGSANRICNNAGYGVIGGGVNNVIDANATVAGILGGDQNLVGSNTTAAVVCGGAGNSAMASYSTVGGGYQSSAQGEYATVPGGLDNFALGECSMAAGRRAHAHHSGSFVWADNHDEAFDSDEDNQFKVRCYGGVKFLSGLNPVWGTDIGVRVVAGGSSWSSISDRNAKANFVPVDGRQILERLAAVPVTTWNLKTQQPNIRHIGPMAQDFMAAFHVGEDERYITTSDADGVAFAAIQGLYGLVQQKDAEIGALQARLAELEKTVRRLSREMERQDAAPVGGSGKRPGGGT